jgi:hypothetical protein
MFRRSTLDLPFRDSLQGIDDVLALQVAQFAITNLVRQSIEAMAHRRTALLSRKMLGGEVLHHFAYRRLCRFSGRCIALRFLCDTQGRKARLAFCHEISASMTIGFPLARNGASLGEGQTAVVEPTRYTFAGRALLIEYADRETSSRALE